MLITHLKDKFHNYALVSSSIGDLQAFYKESKKCFDDEPDFKKRAYNCVVKLQSFDSSWSPMSLKKSTNIFIEVKLVERGESYYQNLMNDVLTELEAKKMLI